MRKSRSCLRRRFLGADSTDDIWLETLVLESLIDVMLTMPLSNVMMGVAGDVGELRLGNLENRMAHRVR
jgi:hypothetical protein